MTCAALSARRLARHVLLPGGGRLELFNDVNIDVSPGESVAIVGRSGSGKTSLLSILGLLSPPDSGSIAIDGAIVSLMSDRALSRLRNTTFGFVFQGYSLVAHMTARQNVELPLLQGDRLNRKERQDLVDHTLRLAQIEHRAASLPRQLSGGEQQRVAIARALVRTPRLLVADEPTGALDNRTAEAILDLLLSAAIEQKTAVVLATHDPVIAQRATRVLELSELNAQSSPSSTPA